MFEQEFQQLKAKMTIPGKEKYNQKEDAHFTHRSVRQMKESLSDSQNFCLKLSQNSNISDDTLDYKENTGEDSIVVISDSSSTNSSPRHSNKQKHEVKKNQTKYNKIYVLDSSDSNSSDSGDENFYQTWKTGAVHAINDCNNVKDFIKETNVLLTSDDSSVTSSENNGRLASSSGKSSSSRVSPISRITQDSTKNATKSTPQFRTTCQKEVHLSSSSTASSDSTTFSGREGKHLIYSSVPNSVKQKKLTKQDAQNIMKNIQSTRMVYESPRLRKQMNVIIDESTDDDVHPAVTPTHNLKNTNQIINETSLDSDNDVVEDSQSNLPKHHKTHISRFFDGAKTNKSEEKLSSTLSERKKKQISQWLMTNSPDSRSDSSFSNVSASNRNSVSSGNSSLERLEMNYETPNNRGKLQRVPVHTKKITIENCDTLVPSPARKQTTIDDYTELSKDNTRQLCTPQNQRTLNNIPSTPNECTPQNADIMDYADILDNLYGDVWRSKADALLPVSEPRKQVKPTEKRYVQTERKPVNKGKYRSTNLKNTSDSSLENFKSQTNSTKKTVRKTVRKHNSFINDDLSSESETDTLYYTALTNPRVGRKNVPKVTPVPEVIKNAIAICDSDVDDEADTNIGTTDTRRRRLSFTCDEDESSGTSEYDPGDKIPPKPTSKKETIKTPRAISKTNTRIETPSLVNQKNERNKSFLASLSEHIPVANAHPDAKQYRTDYKNNKESLCKRLFKLYNEKVFDQKLPEDMSIEWNVRMRGTAGFCYNKKSIKTLGGIVRSSRIVLATKILDTPDRLRDTLIHEMCHAAAWLINNVSDGHGPYWTGWANKAMKTFPELPQIRRCHDYKIKTKFTYRCVDCGYSIGRHSKSLDTERKRCGHCYGKFELLINKTTKSGTVQMQTPKREPTAFALYVKENYNSVKKERNAKHGEVMKILGQQFSAIKIANQHRNPVDNDSSTPG